MGEACGHQPQWQVLPEHSAGTGWCGFPTRTDLSIGVNPPTLARSSRKNVWRRISAMEESTREPSRTFQRSDLEEAGELKVGEMEAGERARHGDSVQSAPPPRSPVADPAVVAELQPHFQDEEPRGHVTQNLRGARGRRRGWHKWARHRTVCRECAGCPSAVCVCGELSLVAYAPTLPSPRGTSGT